jgi:hypothetical protein
MARFLWRTAGLWLPAVFIALVVFAASRVYAAPACSPANVFIAGLVKGYGERQARPAMYRDDGSWRFFYARISTGLAGDKPSSWTIFDLVGSTACLVSAGRGLPAWVIDAVLERGRA